MPFRHTVIAVSIGAGAALVLGSGVALYGAHREVAGVTKERARAEAAQRAMTEAYQLEKDRADAQYRGAVLAREAAKIGLAAARAEPPAVIPRIPEPAADLMKPAPTGSEVLQRATRNMETWLPTPPNGPTR